MNSNLVPTATIELDKPRTLRMDLNALSDFERVSGKSLMRGMDFSNLLMADVRDLLWACLVQEDESLTVHQVGAMLHPSNIQSASEALKSLFKKSVPDQEEGEEPGPLSETTPAASTG